jgi:putative transposase
LDKCCYYFVCNFFRAEVMHQLSEGFEVLPKRLVVERTFVFGWPDWFRRLSKDYERLPEMSEAAIYAAMTRMMVRRLAA